MAPCRREAGLSAQMLVRSRSARCPGQGATPRPRAAESRGRAPEVPAQLPHHGALPPAHASLACCCAWGVQNHVGPQEEVTGSPPC